MAWDPTQPTTDGNHTAEHWYRGDDAYEENTRVTVCSDDGDVVGSWTDKAGNADHVSQATAGNKPTWQDNELNGHPVIRFDGTDDYLQGAFTTGGAMSQPFTVFAVAALDASVVNDNSSRIICDGDDGTNRGQLYKTSAGTPDNWAILAGTRLDGNSADSNWNIWSAVFNGGSSQFWHNGVSEASGNAGATAPDGLTVGADNGPGSYWFGDIAEIIIFDANLSAADRMEVEIYLATRYGLSSLSTSTSTTTSTSTSTSTSTTSSSTSTTLTVSSSTSTSTTSTSVSTTSVSTSTTSSSTSTTLTVSSSTSTSTSTTSSSTSTTLTVSTSSSTSTTLTVSSSTSTSTSTTSSSTSTTLTVSTSSSTSTTLTVSSSTSTSTTTTSISTSTTSTSISTTTLIPCDTLQFADYQIWLLDWNATKIRQLFPGDDFLSIAWQHRPNAPSPYHCEFVAETATKDAFLKHYQVLIERNWSTCAEHRYDEYVGFHLGEHERWLETGVDEHYWASLGLSPEWLPEQPLLQPVTNAGNDNWAFYDTWWASDYADNVLKQMVGESMISPADSDRRFANMALQGNTGNAVWGCYEGKWVRLLMAMVDTIGEDGSKGGCDFSVERVTGGYEFRTHTPFEGIDRRRGNSAGNPPTVFSFENGNMRNPDRKILWAEEVTVAYGGWEGGDQERTIYEEENAVALAESPYSRREGFYDLRDVTTPDTISGILQQKLIDDGLTTFVTAEILQTSACLYGRDWWFGDLVTLDLPDGTTYDMRVVEVNGRIDGDNEETIEGVIELWTRG